MIRFFKRFSLPVSLFVGVVAYLLFSRIEQLQPIGNVAGPLCLDVMPVILFTILGDAIFAWIPVDKIILVLICCIPVGVVYYLIKKFVLDPKKQKREEE